jgi:hypothetical protein
VSESARETVPGETPANRASSTRELTFSPAKLNPCR